MFKFGSTFLFNGGEVHTKETVTYPEFNTRFDLWSSDAIMELLLVNEASLRFYGPNKVGYVIPYVPYARQDRMTSYTEPFSIKVMAQLLNSMQARQIQIWDPHSDVTPALINNVWVVPQHTLIANLIGKKQNWTGIVAPDAGAAKKAQALASMWKLPLFQGTKYRDPQTGELSRTTFSGYFKKNARLLVVDDICDGGRTFINLAEAIQENAPDKDIKLDLYVTHGIFSQGTDKLRCHYDNIYCANPKKGNENENSIVLDS